MLKKWVWWLWGKKTSETENDRSEARWEELVESIRE